MGKIIGLLLLICLVSAGSAIAWDNYDNWTTYRTAKDGALRGACDYVRPATAFRDVRVFKNAGVWCRTSNGIECCSVSARRKPKAVETVVVPEPVPVPVCEDVTTCDYDIKPLKYWGWMPYCEEGYNMFCQDHCGTWMAHYACRKQVCETHESCVA